MVPTEGSPEKDEIPPSQPRSPEIEMPPEHHILDEFEKNMLTRAKQDSSLGLAGKGRKKKEAKEQEKAEKAEARKKQKLEAKQAASAASKPDKPAAKKRARSQKPKPTQEVEQVQPTKKRRAPTAKESKGEEVKDPVRRVLFPDGDGPDVENTKVPGKTKPRGSNRTKKQGDSQKKTQASPKTPAKTAPAKKKEKVEVEKVDRPKLPSFSHCQIVAYWSRDAVALKVPGGSKTGWTQAG